MNIVITGASKGIGKETAKLFASNPENTVIAIARDKMLLQDLKDQCAIIQPSNKLITVCFDLKSEFNKYENKLKSIILDHIDRVDILLNNAGYLVNKNFLEMDEQDIHEVFNVNVVGVINLTRLLVPYMGGLAQSHIVNIGSMGGFQGSKKFPGLSIYSASKGAISILSECLAEEFSDKNIVVNCLALGSVNTEMLNKAFPGYHAAIETEQMASYIVNFCLKEVFFINGKVIPVSLNL